MGNAYHNLTMPMPEFCYPGCHRFPALLGTNSIFRRSALLEIGGFDEQFDYFLDETDVNVRLIDAGYTLKQIPKAFVYHRYLPSHIRNEKRVNTNYAPMIRNRIYFSLKNASLRRRAVGGAIEGLGDLVPRRALQRELEYFAGEDSRRRAGTPARGHGLRGRRGHSARNESPTAIAGLGDRERNAGRSCIRRAIFRNGDPACRAGEFKPCPILLPKPEKLTIALLSQQYPPGVVGGIGRLTHDLAQGLADRGHNVHVLTRADRRNRREHGRFRRWRMGPSSDRRPRRRHPRRTK